MAGRGELVTSVRFPLPVSLTIDEWRIVAEILRAALDIEADEDAAAALQPIVESIEAAVATYDAPIVQPLIPPMTPSST